MTNESSNSVMELIKRLSHLNETELVISPDDYKQLIEELWNHDIFLKEKYMNPDLVPKIYSLFNVNIRVVGA